MQLQAILDPALAASASNTIVNEIEWRARSRRTRDAFRPGPRNSRRYGAIVTLPIGVPAVARASAASPCASIRRSRKKQRALAGLASGPVIKVNCCSFASRSVEELDGALSRRLVLSCSGAPFPTFWTPLPDSCADPQRRLVRGPKCGALLSGLR